VALIEMLHPFLQAGVVLGQIDFLSLNFGTSLSDFLVVSCMFLDSLPNGFILQST
jgi:hypothetical protein